jgi:tryptophanyl-tRNA synthetase
MGQMAATTKEIVLTGIKPTGKVHVGNYIGAIKPALELARTSEGKTAQEREHGQKSEQGPGSGRTVLFFIADYHGLILIQDAREFRELSYGIAATWLALGLDPSKVVFYRQSDVPEIFELTWILSCLTPKGLMNRAHAYKAIVERNEQAGVDLDAGVNMGLYTYPILMAADILLFQSDLVPVGKDQAQHVEIARDLAEAFNRQYGETFNLPRHLMGETTAVVPGLDGRKMSKSYGNTIPLFEPEEELSKLIARIKTDSTLPNEPKNPDASSVFLLFKEFAEVERTRAFREKLLQGIGWGEAKRELFEVMNEFLVEPRRKYRELLADPAELDRILADGARKARELAAPTLSKVRERIGRG